ncbi:MAG: hypothetical protein HY675_11070 [Chloroflexi bacterium]|nr:hypothetical protein [Chloroflexota bacterium]
MRKVLMGVGIFAIALVLVFLLGCAELQEVTASKPSSSSGTTLVADTDVPLKLKTIWAGSYQEDIQPIFDRYCVECHGTSKAENGLRLDAYERMMAGTRFGPVVVGGSSSTSSLAFVIDGTAAQQIQMPHEGRKLSRNRIANVKAWIDAGAKR